MQLARQCPVVLSPSKCVATARHVLVDNMASKCDYLKTFLNYATLQ